MTFVLWLKPATLSFVDCPRKMNEALMPREVLNLKYSSLVLSRTGHAGHYQSGDAIIEEINKEGKRDLVGVPSETQWKRAFRNLDMMNQVRSSTFRDAGIKDTKVSSYDTECDIKKEVQLIREVIRGCKYLENTWESCEQLDITKSVSLSNNRVNFTAIAKYNLTKCLPKGELYKMLCTVHWQNRKRQRRLRIAQFLKLSKKYCF